MQCCASFSKASMLPRIALPRYFSLDYFWHGELLHVGPSRSVSWALDSASWQQMSCSCSCISLKEGSKFPGTSVDIICCISSRRDDAEVSSGNKHVPFRIWHGILPPQCFQSNGCTVFALQDFPCKCQPPCLRTVTDLSDWHMDPSTLQHEWPSTTLLWYKLMLQNCLIVQQIQALVHTTSVSPTDWMDFHLFWLSCWDTWSLKCTQWIQNDPLRIRFSIRSKWRVPLWRACWINCS